MAQDQKRDSSVRIPAGTVRLPNPSAQPFVAALKTTRFFAVLFFWVAMVCVLAHVAAFVVAEWVGLYDEPTAAPAQAAPGEAAPGEAAATAPAPSPAAWARPGLSRGLLVSSAWAAEAAPASRPPGELFPNVPPEGAPARPPAGEKPPAKPAAPDEGAVPERAAAEAAPAAPAPAGEVEGTVAAPPAGEPVVGPPRLTPEQQAVRARYWRKLTANILGPARVVGILASILLAVTVFLYLQIALLGRLGGIRQITRSLFLLLVFLVTVLPWSTVFEGVHASSLFDFEQLLSDHALGLGRSADRVQAGLYYGRYFVFPVISMLLLGLAGIHFASGYSQSVLANE